jgi:hypothetical protein
MAAVEPTGLMERVREALAARAPSMKAAAAEIGVTINTLERHLGGEHVRSDSRRKYEDWLSGRAGRRSVFRRAAAPRQAQMVLDAPAEPEVALPFAPECAHLVVDIFSGCGGLSLGFDLLDGGRQFRTVLAMDVVSATIEVMNRNYTVLRGHDEAPVARVADLTEFLDETEVLAFYLDHVIRLHKGVDARHRMDALAGGTFPRFLAGLRAIDEAFLDELATAREAPPLPGGVRRTRQGGARADLRDRVP